MSFKRYFPAQAYIEYKYGLLTTLTAIKNTINVSRFIQLCTGLGAYIVRGEWGLSAA